MRKWLEQQRQSWDIQSSNPSSKKLLLSLFLGGMYLLCSQRDMEKVFVSDCFGLLPIAYDLLEGCKERNAIVVVVSPLTAIMKDQVSYCWEGGTGFNQDLNFRCEHRQGGVVWL